jgi:hypothetical protein
MREDACPQINASKIVFGGSIAGAIFTVGSMLIFLVGLPVLRYMFPAAILLGCGVALALRFVPHETPGAPWLLTANEKETELPPKQEREKNPVRSANVVIVPIATYS